MPVMDVTILLITHVFFRVVGERDVSVLTGSKVLACLLDDFKIPRIHLQRVEIWNQLRFLLTTELNLKIN